MLGLLARWAGLLHVNQVRDCTLAQREQARSGSRAQNIAEVMLRAKLLRQEQVNALLSVMAAPPVPDAEAELVTLLVETQKVERAKLERCIEKQKTIGESGRAPPHLALLAVVEKACSDQQVVAALREQKKSDKGLRAMPKRSWQVSPRKGRQSFHSSACRGDRCWQPQVWRCCACCASMVVMRLLRPSTPRLRQNWICESCGYRYVDKPGMRRRSVRSAGKRPP